VFLQRKPTWIRWQRWVTGTLLGAVGVKLALDAPAPASPA
jgi:threonine/homoserine/homoserine lactone efflux protein